MPIEEQDEEETTTNSEATQDDNGMAIDEADNKGMPTKMPKHEPQPELQEDEASKKRTVKQRPIPEELQPEAVKLKRHAFEKEPCTEDVSAVSTYSQCNN